MLLAASFSAPSSHRRAAILPVGRLACRPTAAVQCWRQRPSLAHLSLRRASGARERRARAKRIAPQRFLRPSTIAIVARVRAEQLKLGISSSSSPRIVAKQISAFFVVVTRIVAVRKRRRHRWPLRRQSSRARDARKARVAAMEDEDLGLWHESSDELETSPRFRAPSKLRANFVRKLACTRSTAFGNFAAAHATRFVDRLAVGRVRLVERGAVQRGSCRRVRLARSLARPLARPLAHSRVSSCGRNDLSDARARRGRARGDAKITPSPNGRRRQLDAFWRRRGQRARARSNARRCTAVVAVTWSPLKIR